MASASLDFGNLSLISCKMTKYLELTLGMGKEGRRKVIGVLKSG